ncbi:ankyrin repeat domain-containing protein [Campylobacter curvus]|uniref:ankyrin repeat domain-containing protein n=1 Tax=Campylobacter curvus TaxID=200 RepID=UPI0032D5A8FF
MADENGYTLLHKEAIAGNLTTIKILLQNFADKNAQTDDGKTALEFASIMGWEHIVKELKQG